MQRKTKLEILQETYSYYSDPSKRATNDYGDCQYLTDNGNMCAIGRCLINPKGMEEYTYGVAKFKEDHIILNLRLKPEYRGHDLVFWEDLQAWHDSPSNFDMVGAGISKQGEQHYRELVEKYTEK